MENTTMTKGTVPMSTSQTHSRIERSLSARLLAPVMGHAWGTALSADVRGRAIRLIQGGIAAGRTSAYAPAATTSVTTTLTTPFMDVDDLRSGRPPV